MKNQISRPAQQVAEQAARKHLGFLTLTAADSDRADFREVACWSIEAALAEAFEAGRKLATIESHRGVATTEIHNNGSLTVYLRPGWWVLLSSGSATSFLCADMDLAIAALGSEAVYEIENH